MEIDYIDKSDNTDQNHRQREPLALDAFVRLITDKWTSKPPKEKNLNNAIYAQATILRREHNSSAFFIKLSSQRNKVSIVEQWKEVKGKIRLVIEDITREFMAVGGIISIEMHKNTSKTNKRGTNSKAGYPHLLMMLWITHAELYEDIEERLRRRFLEFSLEVGIFSASTRKDIKKYLTYTIKEAADPDLIEFCKQHLQLPATTMVWACHTECKDIFEEIQRNLSRTKKEYSSFFEEIKKPSLIPTTKEEKNKDIILAQIFNKLFKERGWAVYLDKIYRRQCEKRFTWEEHGRLDVWLTQPDKEYKNKQIENLKTLVSLKVITNRLTNKNSFFLQKSLFPELLIETNLMEIEEGVYDFKTGRIKREQISPFTHCMNYYPGKYQEMKPPYKELGVIYLLANIKQEGIMAEKIGNKRVCDVLKDISRGLIVQETLKGKAIEEGRDNEENINEEKWVNPIYLSSLETGIELIEVNKEIIILIKKHMWKEINEEDPTKRGVLPITAHNERIFMHTSKAFAVLVNSIFLREVKEIEIELPKEWYKKCKPDKEEKEKIERIGFNCFQYIIKEINKRNK